jgi:hypothetical protein
MIKVASIKEEMQALADKYKAGMANRDEMVKLFKYWGMSDEGIKFRIELSLRKSILANPNRLN